MHQRRAEQENGSAYPELDKLMLICELFHCTLDDLLKGDMKENSGVSRDTYETHKNERNHRWNRLYSCGDLCLLLFEAFYG